MLQKTSFFPGPCSNKFWLCTILVLQNSLTSLLGRFTRKGAPEDLYKINHFILVGEVVKLLISLMLEVRTEKNLMSLQTFIWQRPRDTLKMAIPAIFYWGSNTLLYVALSNLTVPIFQVAYQGKLILTALISTCVFGRTYVTRQWFCLVVISLSVAFIATEDTFRNRTSTVTATESPDVSSHLFLGLGAIAIACLLSVFAGVYFEFVIKTDTAYAKMPSLWIRNIQLAVFSILVAIAQLNFTKDSGNSANAFFHGFTYFVWCQLILFAAGGILVAAVIKHSDNVIKGLATGISVLVSTAGSVVLYRTSLTPTSLICIMTTVAAIFSFFDKSLSWSQHKLFVTSALALMLPFAILNMITPIQDWRLLQIDIPTNPTNVFPTNWNSTITALDTLRSIQNQIVERHFHEATHILYDLRTAIGNRPAKYLEIGSYTGISAALMLRHPMPTFATLIDPCVLDPSHFQGSLSQEETIRKNLENLTKSHSCDFRPWELRVGFSPQALPSEETFDIIFIDGDHSAEGVWSDYSGAISLLRPGGFMVFDDYLDESNSPEVRHAVDKIAQDTHLIAIGSLRNVHNIHPEVNQSFINEFIFQKRGEFRYMPISSSASSNSEPMLGIAVPSYRRSDGSTPYRLEKLWKMLLNQSYGNWKMYLTGDFYDNVTEWESLSFFYHTQASPYNLNEPGERGKMEGHELWNNAGATAINNAIDRILSDGIQWVVRLDDDDIWDNDHLQNVVAGIQTGATFVMTECQYIEYWLPPNSGLTNISHSDFPIPCQVIHSSTAYNAAKLTSRYKVASGIPADAYMWSRIIFDDYFYPAFVPVKSCHHLEETNRDTAEMIHRRFDLLDRDPPPGWYRNASRYSSLASETFPSDLSIDCVYIIGPKMQPPLNYSDHFAKLPLDMIPYHIRIVEAFAGLPVWGKQAQI